MILNQAESNADLLRLFAKISKVYAMIGDNRESVQILKIIGKLARQMLECADFITHYSDTKSDWQRLGKDISQETDATIQSYSNVLHRLVQQFRGPTTHNISLYRIVEDIDFSGIEPVTGAGLDTSRCCLPGTRETILSDIKFWICNAGEDKQRVLWLSGTAGTGKSTIAHTIAKWFDELGGLTAYFSFDRTRGVDQCHEKIFTTIARDLAVCNPIVRRALARAVHDHRYTAETISQWEELVIGPVGLTWTALIVIDALDESGEAKSREQILRLLAGKLNASSSQLTEIPENFRIIVTSRPFKDIQDALHAVPHVKHVSMDDIPSTSTNDDIKLYVSNRLKDLPNDLSSEEFAQKSGGLFEWARLACDHITAEPDPAACFKAMNTEEGLLDDMFEHILAGVMPEDGRGEVIPMFRSVMSQILASQEPPSMATLTAMRLHFPCDHDRCDVAGVIGRMGPLLIGIADSWTPIRPLHASFYKFLAQKSRSHDFFVDISSIHRDLALASLRVMEKGLRFNICDLETSYLPNSAVPNLQKRVEGSISTELSYSCRFWGTHLQAASFERTLAQEVEALFSGERLLFWLEALALMKSLSSSRESLSSIANWFTGHSEFMHIGEAARDTQSFVQTFGNTIEHSTPHLYLSALPFSQSQSISKFVANFPCTPRVVCHVIKPKKILQGEKGVMSIAIWGDGKRIICGSYDGTIQIWGIEADTPSGELRGHTGAVWSVGISRDGKRIVSGSNDRTVRVWDAEGKKVLGTLKGHIGAVRSVVISPDGQRIASGSNDKTIRVWTTRALGPPSHILRGHTAFVLSVDFSPDGTRIVSGSADNTIWIWDVETGQAFGAPLRVHTDWVQSVTFSHDGTLIVSGSRDMTIVVWDALLGEAFGAPLQGHTDDVLSVAISPDKKYIVSGSADHSIRVWDAEIGKVLRAPLQEHTDYVRSVSVSSDKLHVVSGSDDKTIRVWDYHQVFKAPGTSTSNLTRGSSTPASLIEDGWLVGPDESLLLYIPTHFRPSITNQMLVLSCDSHRLDLSNFEHGSSWHKCREKEAVR
ncbi:hypothetical protein BDR04DRAFT_1064436 [Suillus decipiens]|nr:hypothetical protein BDR04DRAFT_1064436 [Suillus decipiens]